MNKNIIYFKKTVYLFYKIFCHLFLAKKKNEMKYKLLPLRVLIRTFIGPTITVNNKYKKTPLVSSRSDRDIKQLNC